MKPRPALAEFKIFIAPRTSPQYVILRIHRTEKDVALWRGRHVSPFGVVMKSSAYFRPANIATIIKISGEGRQTRTECNACIGDMNFHPKSLSAAIIAHECYHAVQCWAQREGCQCADPDETTGRHDNEEICAEAIGSLVAQVMLRAAKWIGIDKKQLKLEQGYL